MNAKKETIVQWLMELNRQWGLDCLELDDQSQCHLSTGDHEFSFGLSADEQAVLFWAPLVPAQPFLDEREMLADLLVMNYEEEALMGANLSIDGMRRNVQLNYRVPANGLDAQSLGNLLCNFGETVAVVQDLLANRGARKGEMEADRPMEHFQFTRV